MKHFMVSCPRVTLSWWPETMMQRHSQSILENLQHWSWDMEDHSPALPHLVWLHKQGIKHFHEIQNCSSSEEKWGLPEWIQFSSRNWSYVSVRFLNIFTLRFDWSATFRHTTCYPLHCDIMAIFSSEEHVYNVFLYVCNLSICVCHVCRYVYMYTHICVCVGVCMFVGMHACIHT